jgi:hypothetical protein
LAFLFGHCIVFPFYLAIALSPFYLAIDCLCFLFGHCFVSPFYLAIVLSLLFIWPLYVYISNTAAGPRNKISRTRELLHEML